MPDDRELLDTGASSQLLGDRFPGMAAGEEAVMAISTEHIDGDDVLVKKPLGFLFWFAIAWVTAVLLAAILANVLPLQSPTFGNFNALNQGPSAAHWLGTDDLGRDLLARLVFGSRVSLIVGFVGMAIGLIIGGTAGLISGYKGGKLDVALNAGSFIILGIGTIPLMYRVIRASSLTFSQRDFVIAAKTMGASDTRIVLREILPNVIPVAVTFSLITVAGLIVIEGTLAFLGLSVNLPIPSWGNVIVEGTANNSLAVDPYIMMWPALAMFLLLWSINLIGDRLRQRFDLREGLI